MGGLGSDAAIEAADVVVMDDDIARIPLSLKIAKFTRKVVIQNIVVALVVKGVFIALGTVGVAGMWEAVIADVGVALLAVINALRTAGYAKNQSRLS
jgi:Cd2+/Zn2+-exporting ATPase